MTDWKTVACLTYTISHPTGASVDVAASAIVQRVHPHDHDRVVALRATVNGRRRMRCEMPYSFIMEHGGLMAVMEGMLEDEMPRALLELAAERWHGRINDITDIGDIAELYAHPDDAHPVARVFYDGTRPGDVLRGQVRDIDGQWVGLGASTDVDDALPVTTPDAIDRLVDYGRAIDVPYGLAEWNGTLRRARRE